ncbi:MAG: HypC/HybG/HupF family hydrogenase formation chaperone [Actinobacteria bacterium]|nr:HypC/HybG/HupF family hydrogenase formation chaperone [Actinomycetota bacterium]
MCLSVPARVVALDADRRSATVDVLGATREASVLLLPEVAEGDWVLVHVGFAIARIDEDEAAAALALLDDALTAEGDSEP